MKPTSEKARVEKYCCGCKESKPLSEFYRNKRSKDGYQPRCKICMRDAYTSTRNKKKDHYNHVRQIRINATRTRYYEWKRATGCAFCGENESCCLEPHHLDPAQKDMDPSKLWKYSWHRLTEELQKCILVCSNCHKKIHAGLLTVEEKHLNIHFGD